MGLVLIAEDEEAMLELFGDVVEHLGHRTMRALNGEEALLLAQTERPDLVVSDHMMPRKTGLQLLHALRSDPDLTSVPFVLVSAARPNGLEQADEFLTKPVDIDAFEAAVNKALTPVPDGARKGRRRDGRPHRTTDALREEMLNWLAHEIKTPLAAARMGAQMLLRKLDGATESEPERKLSATIIRQLDRMNALITSILDASRLSEGEVTLDLRRLDLATLSQEVVRDWSELHPQATITLVGADDHLHVAADAERLRHVLNNLIGNAIKYSGDTKRVEVTLRSSPGSAVIEVRDWGEGIAASKLPTIFDRFHRADEGVGGGHGLGLFIAAALSRLHGGTLVAHSEIGKGSTFTLRLPLGRGERG
jgi:two-component system sensor histidine kinase/response regulator